MKRLENKKYRDGAKDEQCKMNVAGVCNYDPDTVVLAHVKCLGGSWGAKTHDFSGVDACSACHEWLDSYKGEEEDRLFYTRRGIIRTLENRFERGLIKWGNK